MLRATLCAVAVFAAASFARAEELDKEAPGPKPPAAKSTAPTVPGTELDKESPDAAHRYHGGWGYHGGFHGGWGWGGGWGYRGGWGWGGGWGYRSYSVGFYRPIYPSFYGPSFVIGYPGFGFGYNPWYW
jgi:hypothetical protein